MQDLLGDVHDLDVLRADIKKESANLGSAEVTMWLEKIAAERKSRLNEFRARTSDKNSPWLVWRSGFQWGHALIAAPALIVHAQSKPQLRLTTEHRGAGTRKPHPLLIRCGACC
jgi:CHAD domain-containing protein